MNNIFKLLFWGLFLFFPFNLFSQTIERQLISSGGDFANPDAQINWSIGEPIIETYLLPNNHLTQGFQQGEFVALPLPVELFHFGGNRIDQKTVKLSWEIGEEINIEKYEIKRRLSTENIFQNIGKVIAENRPIYQFFDENNFEEAAFYRLTIIENNGQFSYSNIIKITGVPLQHFAEIFPNPTTDIIQVSILPDTRINFDYFDISISNSFGQTISKKRYYPDNQKITIDSFKELPNGTYSINIITNTNFQQNFTISKI